jgi:hypothetical protein
MEQPYSVKQTSDRKWVVSVGDQELMVCTLKSDALKATEEAAELLKQPTKPITHG